MNSIEKRKDALACIGDIEAGWRPWSEVGTLIPDWNSAAFMWTILGEYDPKKTPLYLVEVVNGEAQGTEHPLRVHMRRFMPRWNRFIKTLTCTLDKGLIEVCGRRASVAAEFQMIPPGNWNHHLDISQGPLLSKNSVLLGGENWFDLRVKLSTVGAPPSISLPSVENPPPFSTHQARG